MANNSNDQKFKHKVMLFVNNEGYSLHFVLCMKDTSDRDKLKETLETCVACVSTDLNDIGPHSIVLADSSASCNLEKVEVFKPCYVYDCIERTRILDISKYLWSQSNIYRSYVDYMEVVYFRKYTWDTIPPKFFIQKDDKEDGIIIESDSDEDSFTLSFTNLVNSTTYSTNHTSSNKKTRTPYTRREKEAIIQHLISRNLYTRVKGVRIWQEMERLDICPIRTWQSMKEHYLKVISKELTSYSSLTLKQKKSLLEAL